MKIALLGTRGIPANYGGFETFAEELSVRLARRGHDVTVYCRSNYSKTPDPFYRGVRLRRLPTIPHKYFDTIAHTFLSTLHLLFRRYDAVLYCNGANSIFTAAPRLLGMPTALNVDGLERKRRKWNAAARAWYSISERLSTWLPNELITDAAVIQRYYADRYGKPSRLIAYGTETGKLETDGALRQFGLTRGGYFLYVSRMEPENNPLMVVKAFEQISVEKNLVMVGDAPYAAGYIREVRRTKDPRILFTGAVYGRGYHELLSHCFAYVHATEVGGTHPALVEAMGRGCPVLFLNAPENAEVASEAGLAYEADADGLARAMEQVAAMGAEQRANMGEAAMELARQRYDWEAIAGQYENLFKKMIQSRGRREAVS